jgi:hypothetical protein
MLPPCRLWLYLKFDFKGQISYNGLIVGFFLGSNAGNVVLNKCLIQSDNSVNTDVVPLFEHRTFWR